ncbi:MAG: phytoene/squalene synthase family protein [Phycisphaerae bacterium]
MTTSTMAKSSASLDRSRAYCERLTRQYARNFYYGLRLLPAQKRASMYALYAWMRLVDDIADHEDGRGLEARAEQLEQWRADTHAVLDRGPDAAGAYAVRADSADVWPAFYDMATRHGVPRLCFDEVIAGQHQDLRPMRLQTFDELEQYCYRVAGVVGLASIHVWGFEGGRETEELAVKRGLAFQLTNVLRDVREDAARGRLYLPVEEIERHFAVGDLLAGRVSAARAEPFFAEQVARAQRAYAESASLDASVSADSRPTLVAMTEIYRGLLTKIAQRPGRVLTERVSLSLWTKLRIGWRATRAAKRSS